LIADRRAAYAEAMLRTAQLRLDHGAPIMGLVVQARLTAGMAPDRQGNKEGAAIA